MSSAVDLHVLYRIGNTPILEYPFPHILVRDVFPEDFYRELRANLPEQGNLKSLGQIGRIQGGDYPARLVMPLTRESIAPLPPAKRAFWESIAISDIAVQAEAVAKRIAGKSPRPPVDEPA